MIELLRRFGGKFRRYMVIGPACKLIEVIFDLLTPLVIAQMIDKGIGAHDVNAVIHYGMLLAAMAVIGISFTLVCQKMAALTSQGMGTDIRGALYQHINKLSYAELDRFGTPSLITRITNDVNQVQLAVALGVRMLIRWPFLAVGSMVAALAIDLKLGVIFLICTPAIGLVFWFVMARCIPYYRQLQAKLDRIALICREGLSGARVVRAFVREDHEIEKFDTISGTIYKDFSLAERILALNSPLMQGCVYACMILVSWLGAKQIVIGNMSTGNLMSFFTYIMQILSSLMMLSMVFVMITMSRASAERIVEVLDEESDITNCDNPVYEVKDGSVEFTDVSFSYAKRPDKTVLDDIDLIIPSGQTVGIIGGTGSSKSSLVQLIPRLYDVTGGCVKVGGVDVRNYDLQTLRHNVAMVLQKNTLFSGTIKENLRWGNPDATDEELVHACRLAQADDFIRTFPDGYDTYIEQGGTNVSGGQKQRLCIARAILRKPKILILADSTSAVDTKTDALIRQAFREEIPNTTKIIIAQRISSVMDADQIVVMDNGRINACGTHEELLANNEIYREVYESQQKGGLEE